MAVETIITVDQAVAELERVARKCWEEFNGPEIPVEELKARINSAMDRMFPPRK